MSNARDWPRDDAARPAARHHPCNDWHIASRAWLRGSPRSPSLKLIEPAKTQMNGIYQKTGVDNRARLVKLVLALAGG